MDLSLFMWGWAETAPVPGLLPTHDLSQATRGFFFSLVWWMLECFSRKHQLVQRENPASPALPGARTLERDDYGYC